MKRVLMITGDFTEDYETMVPYQAMEMAGISVDAVCPDRKKGDKIKTAIHDFEGDLTYTEKPGHYFALTADFDKVDFDSYDGLFLTGGRSPEYLRLNHKVISLVKCFVRSGKPVASICHGAQILTAADVLQSRTLTSYPAIEPEIRMAGGEYVETEPDGVVIDGNLITSPAWPGNIAILKAFIHALGIKIIEE